MTAAVKKLSWVSAGEGKLRAQSIVGAYYIAASRQYPGCFYLSLAGDSLTQKAVRGEDAVKAIAQSDFDARIHSALDLPAAEAVDAWCQPMNCGKHTPRKFIVRFEDAEKGDAVFDDEGEARRYFERANMNWNCYLFGALPLRSSPAAAVSVRPICRVMTMEHSSGKPDHYVSIEVGDRQITPHCFKTKGRAEYEVAEWKWLFDGGEKPFVLDFDTDAPAGAATAAGEIAWTPDLEAARMSLCEYWIELADEVEEGAALRAHSILASKERETEQALTILGDIVNRRSRDS